MPIFGLGRPNLQKLKASGDVEGLLHALGHKDEALRAQALDALIDLATDAALRQHNLAALTALRGSARDQAVRCLAEILRDISPVESGWRNAAVAEVLIELDAADVVFDYYEAHVSGNLKAGLFMLDLLCLLTGYAMFRRDPSLLKKLLQSGPFDYHEVRHIFCFAHLASEMDRPIHQATDVLAEIGSEDDLIALGQQARSQSARQWAWSTLGKVGTAKCVPPVIQAVETGGQHGEWALASLIPRLSTDDLDRLAQHPEARIKNPALLEICKRSAPSTFGIILSAASSETERVKLAAIEALGRMRRPEAVTTLGTLLQHPSTAVWRAAAAAVGAIGDEGGLSSLLTLSPERLVDDVVLRAIAEGGAAPRLLQVLKLRLDQLSPEETLRLVAALRQCVAASDLVDLQDTLARPYAETLADPAWAKRRTAITALGRIGGIVATQALGARQELEQDYELANQIAEALVEAQRSCG